MFAAKEVATEATDRRGGFGFFPDARYADGRHLMLEIHAALRQIFHLCLDRLHASGSGTEALAHHVPKHARSTRSKSYMNSCVT